MTLGIGIDLVQISRIKQILDRSPSFGSKFPANSRKTRSHIELARDIAIFESLFKALPSELRQFILDFEVVKHSDGKPELKYVGSDSSRFAKFAFRLSVSYENDFVIAIVLIEENV